VSPPDAVAGLVEWARARFGGPVELASPVARRGEGFDSDIFLLRLTGAPLPEAWRAPLVLRVKSDPGRLAEAEREAAVHRWLGDLGYPVPEVLAVLTPGEVADRPAQVMTRAPGALMLDRVRRAPWEARRRTAQLAALHVRLHHLPPEGFPVVDDLLDRRLALSRRTAVALDDARLQRALARTEALSNRLRGAPGVVCHGDFHPLNVLVDGAQGTVIDWTDAGVGDRHGDVARTLALFSLAAIAASNRVERALLRRVGPLLGRWYRRAYDAVSPLDPERLALWMPVHLLHGWSQVLAVHAQGSPGGEARVPLAMAADLERRFDRALADVGG
jgi:aminoglycoside phosphotransferase (APT) family kinase protein